MSAGIDFYWCPSARAAEAVESPRRLSHDPGHARRLLALVPQVPTPVWGRDELRAGEMWNSNSLISWLIARSGLDADSIGLPRGGRAPGLASRARHRAPPRGSARPAAAGFSNGEHERVLIR